MKKFIKKYRKAILSGKPFDLEKSLHSGDCNFTEYLQCKAFQFDFANTHKLEYKIYDYLWNKEKPIMIEHNLDNAVKTAMKYYLKQSGVCRIIIKDSVLLNEIRFKIKED